MKFVFDLIAAATIAACIFTFAKWWIDPNDHCARQLRRLVRRHMRRAVAAEAKPKFISGYVGLAALAAFPFLALLFVAVALYQLGMI